MKKYDVLFGYANYDDIARSKGYKEREWDKMGYIDRLSVRVEYYMEHGWMPQGGIFLNGVGSAQAMILDDVDDDDNPDYDEDDESDYNEDDDFDY